MKYIIIILLFLGISPFAKADESNTLWQLANHAYQNKNYEAAINLYDSLLKKKNTNAELYYNLGNAYFKNHQMGMAVWCFEKAHKIAPNEEDIDMNLKIANLRLVDKFETTPEFFLFKYWRNLLQLFSVKVWAILAIVFLGMMLMGWLLYYFSFNYTSIGKLFIWVGLIVGAFLLIITWQSNNFNSSDKNAIIISSNATIKSAPDEASTDLFVLHEGTKIQVLKTNNGWINFKLGDGKVGWCEEKNTLSI
jgi:tetratricopeptide (TPR) repeat protein